MSWFSKSKAEPGWMVVALDPEAIKIAHVDRSGNGKPRVTQWAMLPRGEGGPTLQKLAKDYGFDHYQCSTLLRPGEYQIVLVEEPKVAADEMKAAIRWRVKDMLDYHVDDATIDVLKIPADKDAAGRGQSMYAVVARNDVVHKEITQFEEAGVQLEVIDIPEMAQRNLTELVAKPDAAAVMLSFDERGGLLTVTHAGELYFTRRFEVTAQQLAETKEDRRQYYLERVATELQRTMDHCDRQFQQFAISELWLAPLQNDSMLADYLAKNFELPCRPVEIGNVFEFNGLGDMADEDASRMFQVLGAALRLEQKAL